MKKIYHTPVIDITMFHTEDIITSSSVSTETAEAGPLPVEEIPPVLDGNDVFYN